MNYSPKQIAELSSQIYDKLYKTNSIIAESFLKLWLKKYGIGFTSHHCDDYTDFDFFLKINIRSALDTSEDLIIKMALDLGIPVPNITYSITEIKHKLDSHSYTNARKYLEEACQKIYSEPANAFLLANTALESIIKHICEDDRIENCNKNDTLYNITQHILKQFNHYPNKNIKEHITKIGSSFLTIAENIEGARSNFTASHGKDSTQVQIEEPIYSVLAINSIVTLGLFFIDYYEKHYPEKLFDWDDDDNVPF